MSLLFHMLSRLAIVFLPRNKHLLFSQLQSPSAVILEPKMCVTLCNPMDCTSVHGISQARILLWVAFPFSRGSSQPRGGTCIAGRFLLPEPSGKLIFSIGTGYPHFRAASTACPIVLLLKTGSQEAYVSEVGILETIWQSLEEGMRRVVWVLEVLFIGDQKIYPLMHSLEDILISLT